MVWSLFHIVERVDNYIEYLKYQKMWVLAITEILKSDIDIATSFHIGTFLVIRGNHDTCEIHSLDGWMDG